jgi:hypothetical protein
MQNAGDPSTRGGLEETSDALTPGARASVRMRTARMVVFGAEQAGSANYTRAPFALKSKSRQRPKKIRFFPCNESASLRRSRRRRPCARPRVAATKFEIGGQPWRSRSRRVVGGPIPEWRPTECTNASEKGGVRFLRQRGKLPVTSGITQTATRRMYVHSG